MKPTFALILSATILGGVAVAAPVAADELPTGASSEVAAAEYCVEQGPIIVEGVVIFPGGKYCIPGP